MTVLTEEIRRRIQRALPGSEVVVETFHGGADHLRVQVTAPQFEGLSLVEQHRRVYAAVGDLLGGDVHALALKTRPANSGEGGSSS